MFDVSHHWTIYVLPQGRQCSLVVNRGNCTLYTNHALSSVSVTGWPRNVIRRLIALCELELQELDAL